MRRHRGDLRAGGSSQGFTLLEVLLALAVAVLVITLAGSLYYTAARTVAGQENRNRGRHAAIRALERLTHDFTSALPHVRDGDCAFELGRSPDAPDMAACRFCRTRVPGEETDAQWYEVREITLHVTADAQRPDRWNLVRVSRAREGEAAMAPAVTNILLHGITDFQLSLRDKKTWRDNWGEKAPKGTPSAARIELRYGQTGEDVLRTEFTIPAGQVVPSTLERGTTTGAGSAP